LGNPIAQNRAAEQPGTNAGAILLPQMAQKALFRNFQRESCFAGECCLLMMFQKLCFCVFSGKT
jgi:hypothetical protein